MSSRDSVSSNWADDKEHPNCGQCDKAFTLTLRRHHCRVCGGVFCGSCTSRKVELQNKSGLHRVCDGCYKGEVSRNPNLKTRSATTVLDKLGDTLSKSEAEKDAGDDSSEGGWDTNELDVDEKEFLKEEKKLDKKFAHVAKKSLGPSALLDVAKLISEMDVGADQEEKEMLTSRKEDMEPIGALTPKIDTIPEVEEEPLKAPKMNIVILIVGSRGDVQPYVALGKGLKADGHHVRIATHETFRGFVTKHDLDFYPIAGDPKDLMGLMVENNMLSFNFIKASVQYQRTWVKELLDTCWNACHDGPEVFCRPFCPDLIIANPPSFAGIHIGEKLGIPVHMSFTMPWSRTRAFPSPFAAQSANTDAIFNWMSYSAIDKFIWMGMKDIINEWRRNCLLIPPIHTTNWSGHRILHDLRVPHTYCYSDFLLPKPTDWGQHIDVTGFLFLDEGTSYTPPDDLDSFLKAGEPPVFIGFGSIVVKDPAALTRLVVEAVKLAGCRAIIQAGWAGIDVDKNDLTDDMLVIGPAPHDWLFERCAAVVHHGGAGTVSAGLRLGKPTVVVPFFGDQFFWGRVVHDMGMGPSPLPFEGGLTAQSLSKAIQEALKPEMKDNVKQTGQNIRAEDGVQKAIQSIYRSLPLGAMCCEIDSSHCATHYCHTCNIRMCAYCDTIVHGEYRFGKVSSHHVEEFRYIDWAKGQARMPKLVARFFQGGSSAIKNVMSILGKDEHANRKPLEGGILPNEILQMYDSTKGVPFRPMQVMKPSAKDTQNGAVVDSGEGAGVNEESKDEVENGEQEEEEPQTPLRSLASTKSIKLIGQTDAQIIMKKWQAILKLRNGEIRSSRASASSFNVETPGRRSTAADKALVAAGDPDTKSKKKGNIFKRLFKKKNKTTKASNKKHEETAGVSGAPLR